MTKAKRFRLSVQREWKDYCDWNRKRLAANLPPIPDATAVAAEEAPRDPGPAITAEGTWGTMTAEARAAEGWYEYAPGKWRKWHPSDPIDHGPAVWTVDTFQSGRSRWQTHGHTDIGAPDMVEDFAHEDGEKVCAEMGHKYVRLPDGREGPAPFGASWKQKYYEKYTAQRIKDRNEKFPDHLAERRRKLERRALELGLDPQRERAAARALTGSFDPEGR